ncbi:MAG: insulinase family protein [Pseudomonadota bacterium]|nr:insulinase family protein [Pseudomonadota bacterium]
MLPTPDVVERLPSGIEVVIEAMDAPRVVVEHRFRAGAAHEAEDALGVAHPVEHVVFSPVGAEPAGDYERYVEASGGTYGATTHINRTVYRATVRPSGLLEREARRLGPRAFAEAVVARELGAIEEKRSVRAHRSIQRVASPDKRLLGTPFGRGGRGRRGETRAPGGSTDRPACSASSRSSARRRRRRPSCSPRWPRDAPTRPGLGGVTGPLDGRGVPGGLEPADRAPPERRDGEARTRNSPADRPERTARRASPYQTFHHGLFAAAPAAAVARAASPPATSAAVSAAMGARKPVAPET